MLVSVSWGCEVPKKNCAIHTCTCYGFSIRRKCYTFNYFVMFFKCCFNFSRYHIPYSDSLIITSTYKCFPIRTETYTQYLTCMPCESGFLLSCSNVKQSDCTIPMTTCQKSTISTETKILLHRHNSVLLPGLLFAFLWEHPITPSSSLHLQVFYHPD